MTTVTVKINKQLLIMFKKKNNNLKCKVKFKFISCFSISMAHLTINNAKISNTNKNIILHIKSLKLNRKTTANAF